MLSTFLLPALAARLPSLSCSLLQFQLLLLSLILLRPSTVCSPRQSLAPSTSPAVTTRAPDARPLRSQILSHRTHFSLPVRSIALASRHARPVLPNTPNIQHRPLIFHSSRPLARHSVYLAFYILRPDNGDSFQHYLSNGFASV